MDQLTRDFLESHCESQFCWPALPLGDINHQFHWICHHSNIPYLEVHGIDVPYTAMLTEAQSLRDMFVEHRDSENRHRGWRSLAIHGIGAQKTNVSQYYGIDSKNAVYTWTEIQDRCPVTVDFFKNKFPFNLYQRVRYMLLEPDGYIAPHFDNPVNTVASAVNISLNNPHGCRLVTEHGIVPFKNNGSVMMFNNHYKHAVHNHSDIDRFHIIVHGSGEQNKWSRLVVESYQQALERYLD